VGPVVVGREAELAEVERFLGRIKTGFVVLALEGEAGIGKTMVWREALRRAQERGVLVLSCRPSIAEAKFSFGAVGDLLAAIDFDEFAVLPDPQREAVEVALLRKGPAGRAPAARAVATGFLSLVRALADTREVLLAVDDWQWLDLSSRRVLEFAARRLVGERVGLLCSIRLPSSVDLIGGGVAEDREHRIMLGSLSLAALGRILAGRLGRTLPRPILIRIAEASGGNPFYALEIGRLVIERDPEPAAGARLPVPDDLRELTAARIRRLPAAAREAVLLAAVVSTPDRRSVDLDALAPAEAAGIVTVDDAGRIEFAHPLLASAAYRSVPVVRRRELHRLAAERVTDPEQQARHLALASQGVDPAVAAQLDRAASHAAARGAPDAAAELAELAATLSGEENAHDRGSRLLAAAHLWFDAGDLARAEGLAQNLLDDPPRSDALRARALQLLAQLRARLSNFSEAFELAAAALEVAGNDQRLRAAIELDLVYCAVSLGDVPKAEPHARAAMSHAQATGEDGILADALAVLTMLDFLAGRGVERGRLVRALALEDPAGASAFIMRPRVIHGMLQLFTGELDGAIETLGGVYADAIERGQEGPARGLSLYLAWAYVWRGDLERASRVSAEAREQAALLEDPTTSGLALSASALAHAHDGHTALARAEALEALGLFERVQWRVGTLWPLWALGLAFLSEGNPAEVDRTLGPLADQLSAMGVGDPAMAMFVPDEIEALIALGQLDRAEGYLEPWARSAAGLDRAWAIAAAERCRGAIAGARSRREDAYAAFDRSIAAHQRVEMPFERARTLLTAGQTYRRFKQRGRARGLLEEALSVFEQVGAPMWAAKAQIELARVGRPGSDRDALTETERQLAELAASGLSNRQVAEHAFVSVKTVEANLTRVYRKLGVKSRVALANALHAGEGHEPPYA
jgi:DNA-binding CsgD family transcriptional regulator